MMTLRLLSYMLELWELQRRGWDDRKAPIAERRLTPVVPFVFYTGEDNWTTPLAFRNMFDAPPGFERFIPSWETLFLNLRRTPPETLTAFLSAIGWAMRGLQAEKASYEEFEQTLREAMQGIEGLSEEQFGQWIRAAWYLMLLVKHRRPDTEDVPLTDLLLEQTRQSKFFTREETETMYTAANRLIDEGRQISLRSAVERVLAKKFGKLPEPIVSQIKTVTAPEELDALLDRALDAQSLADFTAN